MSRYFGTVDILGVDILGVDVLGVDILGVDISAPTRSPFTQTSINKIESTKRTPFAFTKRSSGIGSGLIHGCYLWL